MKDKEILSLLEKVADRFDRLEERIRHLEYAQDVDILETAGWTMGQRGWYPPKRSCLQQTGYARQDAIKMNARLK